MQGISCSTLARRGAAALLVAAGVAAGAHAAAAQQPAPAAPAPAQPQPQTAQPQQPQQQAQPGLAFDGDAGALLNYIKADKTADFEEVMGKIKESLAKSEDPVRKQQAAGWKVFKVAEPGPNGTVIYMFIIDPVTKGSDYSLGKILVEGFPQDWKPMWDKLSAAYSQSSKLNLQLVQRFGPATQ